MKKIKDYICKENDDIVYELIRNEVSTYIQAQCITKIQIPVQKVTSIIEGIHNEISL